MNNKRSITKQRQKSFYPTPQNIIRIERAVSTDGAKQQKISVNGLINEALNMYFANKSA